MPPPVDAYIAQFSADIQPRLQEMRALLKALLPDAQEVISYQMPAYKKHGIIVYFGGYKNHIGFYPTGAGIAAFAHQLDGYTWSKGAIQLPHNKPLPVDLITDIVHFRVHQDEQLAASKTKKKAVKP